MTETVKHTPERIWACMGGPMVGMFVSGGYTADWPQYVRADIADEMLEALIMALPYVETAELDEGYKPGVVAKVAKAMRAAIDSAEGRS